MDGGHLKRCEKILAFRRGFGTVRFSTSFQPPAVHAYHLALDAFVRFATKTHNCIQKTAFRRKPLVVFVIFYVGISRFFFLDASETLLTL